MATKKNAVIGGRVHVYNDGGKKHKFTLHYVLFGPDNVVTGEEAKKIANRVLHYSAYKIKNDYEVIYAKRKIEKTKGKRVLTSFDICKKNEADAIFVGPKKYHKEARTAIKEFFIP